MAIKVLEIHHQGVRIGADEKTLADLENFYAGVLGLERDKGRPEIPGIPGMWINVGEVGQIHLIGGEKGDPFGQNLGRGRVGFVFLVADQAAEDLAQKPGKIVHDQVERRHDHQ